MKVRRCWRRIEILRSREPATHYMNGYRAMLAASLILPAFVLAGLTFHVRNEAHQLFEERIKLGLDILGEHFEKVFSASLCVPKTLRRCASLSTIT